MNAARFYYILRHGRHGELQLHLSKKEAAELYAKLGRAIVHTRGRGHRVFHISMFHGARLWTKLEVKTHAAHRRHCAAKNQEIPQNCYPWR